MRFLFPLLLLHPLWASATFTGMCGPFLLRGIRWSILQSPIVTSSWHIWHFHPSLSATYRSEIRSILEAFFFRALRQAFFALIWSLWARIYDFILCAFRARYFAWYSNKTCRLRLQYDALYRRFLSLLASDSLYFFFQRGVLLYRLLYSRCVSV